MSSTFKEDVLLLKVFYTTYVREARFSYIFYYRLFWCAMHALDLMYSAYLLPVTRTISKYCRNDS